MRIPILTYHDLDEASSPVSVSPAIFERHLIRLRTAGYRVVTLSEALARLGLDSPGKPLLAVMTFDDGYAAVHEVVLPLLAAQGWRATVFAVTEYVGRPNRWPGQSPAVSEARLMDWSELRELSALGWEIGAHTRSHPDLRLLNDGDLSEETLGAKAVLEDRLGQPVRTFAYPYGAVDRRVRSQVRKIFHAACGTEMGIADEQSDRSVLERVDMWYFSHPGACDLLGTPLAGPYVRLCYLARRTGAWLRSPQRQDRLVRRILLNDRSEPTRAPTEQLGHRGGRAQTEKEVPPKR
jgi:peptidoglycan/xylan/chitin deacetylase (PgdA/CDA1 family)